MQEADAFRMGFEGEGIDLPDVYTRSSFPDGKILIVPRLREAEFFGIEGFRFPFLQIIDTDRLEALRAQDLGFWQERVEEAWLKMKQEGQAGDPDDYICLVGRLHE